MNKNKNGETMVSIMIVVLIISIVLISTIKIVEYDNGLNYEYDKINYISLLEKNTNSLINKVDTLDFKEQDLIFINNTGSTIQAFSGSVNENYKYINYLGENIDILNYKGAIYTRQCLIEKDSEEGQMIKCFIKELIRK